MLLEEISESSENGWAVASLLGGRGSGVGVLDCSTISILSREVLVHEERSPLHDDSIINFRHHHMILYEFVHIFSGKE